MNFYEEFSKLSEKDKKEVLDLMKLKANLENEELRERINKAIEYIKERTEYNQYSEVYPSVLDAREVKNILEILRGE